MLETTNHSYNSFPQWCILMASMIHMNQIIANLIPLFQFLLHVLFSYNIYNLSNKENRLKIMKNLKNYYCYHYDDNKDPLHFVVEKKWFPQYFIYIHDNSDYSNLFLFCKETTLNDLLHENYTKQEISLNDDHIPKIHCDEIENSCDALLEQKSISYLSSSGAFGDTYINERNINLSKFHDVQWFEYQTKLFCKIMDFYKTQNYCKIFLNGPPGKGKTFFAYLMAQRLNCYLMDQYDPSDPGSSLNFVYNRAKKISPNKPLILVLDEVDILIEKIHHKEIPNHKHFKSEVHDKITWNQFLDKISYGLFPFMIVILISNKKKEDIFRLDKTYLRQGRVDLFEEWN